jgi:DNA-binding LacI/PurR family transcriptional regulator
MGRISSQKAAKLSDVAEAAGVSKATASNVFNRPELVREEVRQRVLAAAKSIGYRGPDPKGRMLSAGKVNAIGVVTMEPLAYFFDDPFARVLMRGITDACDASGVGVSLISSANEERLAWNIRSAVVDGLILVCLAGTDQLIAPSRDRRLPFVALDFGEADETMSVVGIDDVEGSRLAARHLAELGHRRFAVLTMEFATDGAVGRATSERVNAATGTYAMSRNRVTGYFEALKAFEIDTGEVPIYETLSDEATVWAAMEEIFAAPAPPTAILAQSDRIAFFALDWLKARGLSVPGDVSVVGFDGVPESATSDPPLTTVQQPIAEIGRRAVRAILDHGGEIWREKLDVQLVVRGSTAPPRNRAGPG